MLQTVRPITSLLLAVAFLLGGAGLLNTLIQVQGAAVGFSDSVLGLFTSTYFTGFLIGTFIAPPLVRRVGHIRAFAFYASTCVCAILLHAMGDSLLLWLLLRIVVGIALVGLYTVIESWLNAQASPSNRGTVFACYMMVNLGSLAIAQQFLKLEFDTVLLLFALAGLLVAASTLPVLITRMAQPVPHSAPRLDARRLFTSAPTAGAGALLSGLAMGPFWGMIPVWGIRSGLDSGQIATFMSVAIIGGAALQLPIGRLSDRRDRRLTIAMICGAACVIAAVLPFTAGLTVLPYVLVFLYGGVTFSVYPVVVAHLLDHLPPEDILSASSSVLLLNGLGSAIGPVLAGLLMSAITPGILFAWFALNFGLLGGYALYRYRIRQRDPALEPHFQPMLRTSHEALGLISEEDTASAEGQPTHADFHDPLQGEADDGSIPKQL